jgi:hypothetical protein
MGLEQGHQNRAVVRRPDLAVVKATIRFLERTGRLTYQQEVIQAV